MNNPIPMWTPFAPPIDTDTPNRSVEFESINLNEVTQTVFNLFEMAAKYKRIKLHLDIEDSAEFQVEGNRADVTHMLTQMVKNAMAQTLEGYIKIRLLKLDNKVIIAVEDSGIGIHPDEKIAMVEVMYRGRLCRITHVQDPKTSMAHMANQLNSHHANLEFSIERGIGMKRRLHLPIKQTSRHPNEITKPESAFAY